MKNLTIFKFEPTTPNMSQYIVTSRNMVAKRVEYVAPNDAAICCIGMLRSFDRAFTLSVVLALGIKSIQIILVVMKWLGVLYCF